MRLTLLGTGAADGWPNPFCTCASCAAAARDGVRGQTSVLIDDELMLDCGAESPRAAARWGVNLADVRHILFTHAHPDHTSAPALRWRFWAGGGPLELVGPPAALDACRPWLQEDWPVTYTAVLPGDRIAVGDYDVRVLPANHGDASVGPPVLYDVSSPAGARLLYATDTALPPEAFFAATAGAEYDLVLLEESNGDDVDSPTAHLNLVTFPQVVGRMRTEGAITDRSRVVAIHLGHGNPRPAELARRLAAWGAEILPDGARVELGPTTGATTSPRWPERILVLGGARSGKSAEAERRLAADPDVTYVATSVRSDADAEWEQRIAGHQSRRPPSWRTVETSDLAPLLRAGQGSLLIDSVSLWVAGRLEEPDLQQQITELVAAWRDASGRVIAVSDEVGSGVVPPTEQGRSFRDVLGEVNAALAREADEVWQVTAGIARRLA